MVLLFVDVVRSLGEWCERDSFAHPVSNSLVQPSGKVESWDQGSTNLHASLRLARSVRGPLPSSWSVVVRHINIGKVSLKPICVRWNSHIHSHLRASGLPIGFASVVKLSGKRAGCVSQLCAVSETLPPLYSRLFQCTCVYPKMRYARRW